jgi:BirA family biotin operon repressor/biotin-[acetyl-CoA-carboxylase] ligase
MFLASKDLKSELNTALRGIALGGVRFFDTTGSSNDQALAWAASGAPDFSLVVADEQTNGRGRLGRNWFTPRGSALAFSLVLRPTAEERQFVGRFSGLGALALAQALAELDVDAEIKWPNDVLIRRKKVAGVLVETVWMGDEIDSLVLGMGVNVSPDSLPPADRLTFPATCLRAEGLPDLQRFALLKVLLRQLQALRAGLVGQEFLDRWQNFLAFRGEHVQIWQGAAPAITARLVGLELDGSLRVLTPAGVQRAVHFGEVHLRPV